jgi:hypothetical protein
MMKLKYSLVAAALAITSAASAQNWIEDTISTGNGYLNNVYYSLENGTAATNPADNWHIGFSAKVFSASIITNSADKGVRLYALNTDPTTFGTDLTTALVNKVDADPMSLYNSNHTWENGAFNNTDMAEYGWGDYDMATHWVAGNVVFGLITASDTFQVFIEEKQTYQVNNAPVYHFKVAKIDGTGIVEKELAIGGSAYVGKNYAFYNIETDEFLDREPLSENWDFMFSNYNDEEVNTGTALYKVFGVINNEGLKVAKVDTADAFFEDLDYAVYEYDTVINSIGRVWKSSGPNGVVMTDSLCYFVKVANGDVWQLVFTYHTTGADTTGAGKVGLKKRKVYEEPISVKEMNAFVNNVLLAPNPAVNGNVSLLIDAKQQLGQTKITITDINGRAISSWNTNLSAGFRQLNLDFSHLNAGLYLVNVSGQGFGITKKLVIK